MEVLLLMTGNFAMFLFGIFCVVYIIFLSIKQNFGHVWLFGPHTLDKLILLIICLSIKQNLGHS